jgi:hypothetical protein
MSEEVTYADAICGGTISSADDYLLLTVSRKGADARQEFFVHRDCLVRVLRPGTPLGEVFDD